MVSFTPRPFYPSSNSHRYPFTKRLVRQKRRYDVSTKRNSSGQSATSSRRLLSYPTEDNNLALLLHCGSGSSVDIVTDYGLDGPGIESRWRRDFPHLSRPALGPTQLPVQWSFPGVKCGRGVTLNPHPLLAPRSWKSRAITLPPSGPQPGL